MIESHSARETSRRATFLASVTILCLLIAPACAPLCAAKMCGRAGHEQCHALPNEAGQNAFSPKSTCRGFDLCAVLPRADKQLTLSSADGPAPSAVSALFSGDSFRDALLAAAREGTPRNPLPPPGTALPAIVLRV